MPLTSAQKALVAQFVQATGTNDKIAQRFLKNANYKLDVAADAYFSSIPNMGASMVTNEAKLEQLFHDLRVSEADTEEQLSIESVLKYAGSLGVDPEKAGIFALLELLKAPSLGTITRRGFIDGWKTTNAQPTINSQKDYIQLQIRNMQNDPDLFRKVYRYAFVAGKESPEQRALALDMALAYWQCFFGEDQEQGKPWMTRAPGAEGTGTINWFELWSEYLKANWTRTVSKDMWNQTLEFALKTMADPTLAFWSPDGAWPSVVDSFVEGVQAKGAVPAPAAATMEVDS